MLLSTRHRNLLFLHFTVLIWGFTGVLGSLILLSALHLVWYRVLIAAITLLIYFMCIGKSVKVSKKKLLSYLGVGLLVGLHWVLFFHAIKISTVSVTLVTLSSLTLFTALLEPLFTRKRISLADIFVGVVIIIGIYLIFKFEFRYFAGILCGLGCAFIASIFAILNSKMVKEESPTIITFYEMVGATIGVSVVLLVTGGFNADMALSAKDGIYLLLLGVVCTAVAYALAVAVMKELRAFTVALVTNLEPVYGILLAMLIFGQKEEMSTGFYLGAGIILTAVFFYPILKSRIGKKQESYNAKKSSL